MIVVTAHSFGLGPAALALSIADKLQELGSAEILFIGTKECCAIVPATARFKYQVVAELTLEALSKVVAGERVRAVVSVLCKAGIDLAKERLVPSFFIDPLVWFWRTIPPQYLEADHYIALKHPGAEIIHRFHRSSFICSQIIPECIPNPSLRHHHVIHLGGVQNPFEQSLPEAYLTLLAEALIRANRSDFRETLLIAGEKTTDFLRPILSPHAIGTLNVSLSKSAELLSSAGRVTTLPGLTAPLISFMNNVPVAFLPPINLSQWHHLAAYRTHQAAPVAASWSELLEEDIDLSSMEERDSSYVFHRFGERLRNNERLRNRAIERLKCVYEVTFDHSCQKNFSDLVGNNGSEQIFALLESTMPDMLHSCRDNQILKHTQSSKQVEK